MARLRSRPLLCSAALRGLALGSLRVRKSPASGVSNFLQRWVGRVRFLVSYRPLARPKSQLEQSLEHPFTGLITLIVEESPRPVKRHAGSLGHLVNIASIGTLTAINRIF